MMKYTPRVRSEIAPISAATSARSTAWPREQVAIDDPSLTITPVT